MNQRERDALDRYITGNYGEDQFREYADFEVSPNDHPFECDPEEPLSGEACYDCEAPEAMHPQGPSRTTRSLRAHATLRRARGEVAAELGVDVDEVF